MGGISRFHPWVGKIPGEGHSNPLWYACLEKLTVREARLGTVHGVAKKNQTQLSNLACTLRDGMVMVTSRAGVF